MPGLSQAQRGVDERGLANSIAPEEPGDGTGPDDEIQVVKDGPPTVVADSDAVEREWIAHVDFPSDFQARCMASTTSSGVRRSRFAGVYEGECLRTKGLGGCDGGALYDHAETASTRNDAIVLEKGVGLRDRHRVDSEVAGEDANRG